MSFPCTIAWSDLWFKPIPLDLLTLANFTDPPTHRGTGLLRGFGGGNKGVTRDTTDARVVYPCTIFHTGRLGGFYTIYAESLQAREEWKDKLQEAIALRKVVQESNKVFEVETLSSDTFVVPSTPAAPTNQSQNTETAFTGKVTCSVPFSKQIVSAIHIYLFANSDLGVTCPYVATADGRALVAIGCAEGLWIGFRHFPQSEVCAPVVLYCRSASFGSHAQGGVPEDGHAMCDARGLWNLPSSCRQGKGRLPAVRTFHGLIFIYISKSRSLHSTSRHSYPRLQKA